MTTACTRHSLVFQSLGRRAVAGRFDGGKITSDAGALLPRETERITGTPRKFAACFTDHRDADLIEHRVTELVAQRVYGLCLGYEDVNDHDALRHDPLPAVLVGKADPSGDDRLRARDKGKALAGKSTLNRLELTPVRADAGSRYKKITVNRQAVREFFVESFLQAHDSPPSRIILDLDATDIPLHGHQAGRFFHGYYDSYCYLPLYIFRQDHLLCAKLRPSNVDASTGALKEVQQPRRTAICADGGPNPRQRPLHHPPSPVPTRPTTVFSPSKKKPNRRPVTANKNHRSRAPGEKCGLARLGCA